TTAPPWVLRVRCFFCLLKLDGSATISARGLIAGSPGRKRELVRVSAQRVAGAFDIGQHCDAVADRCTAQHASTSAVMCTATGVWRIAARSRGNQCCFVGHGGAIDVMPVAQ